MLVTNGARVKQRTEMHQTNMQLQKIKLKHIYITKEMIQIDGSTNSLQLIFIFSHNSKK